MLFTIFFILCTVYVHGDLTMYEGENCVKDGLNGVCIKLRNCQAARKDIQNRKQLQICTFDGNEPIVCCLDNAIPATAAPGPVLTTARPVTTTEEPEPTAPIYIDVIVNENRDTCEPIQASMTSPKTGQKAWDKCLEYQEQLVYPCVKGVAFTGEKVRANRCGHTADELIIGGLDAADNEFPHMVLLGYGTNVQELKWHCGGSLISDRFVLTAGHCMKHIDDGPVTYAILGILRRSDSANDANRYRIKNIIKHPNYRPPFKYNDIALLELETNVKLNQFTVPACLHVGDRVKDDKALATGWGLNGFKGSSALDVLQKVVLQKFKTPDCSRYYGSTLQMRKGFDQNTQTCYGDKDVVKDTCQGDSGGPLQIKSKNITCMYVIVGVTSFGTACGFKQPGIYTRVAQYVPWIESVVWP